MGEQVALFVESVPPLRALVTLFRRAPDADGKPGEWGPWEVFALAYSGQEPGREEPFSYPDGKRVWQQEERRWFLEERA